MDSTAGKKPLIGMPSHPGAIGPDGQGCMSCYFSKLNLQTPGMYFCRRYPPNQFPVNDRGRVSLMHEYPVVAKDMWCGEWVPRDKAMWPHSTPETLA